MGFRAENYFPLARNPPCDFQFNFLHSDAIYDPRGSSILDFSNGGSNRVSDQIGVNSLNKRGG